MAVGPVRLVLTDPLATRIFFDRGIAERLRQRVGGRVLVIFPLQLVDAIVAAVA